ncbi:MAG: asparagine synthase (glutamine-hydrolyzing) [Alphaproteobacteria bacterium 43-37]|nr:MAG: asparagine synthase (glutamine-hydrolyzing) [Alphaproteobacteria bacterium 43-37]
MCGIAGISYREGNSPTLKALKPLTAALAHRGPDGDGYFMDETVGLIHTRLSIIDLGTGGQPLYGENGSVLVANGEIYNHLELKELFGQYPYKTHSDSEVILSYWQRYGAESLKYLRGMYAFALYEPKTKDLFLARDPFGIKPLYYTLTKDYLAFASEPMALVKAELASNELCPQAVHELLQLRFSTCENTPFLDIKRLLPGEVLQVREGSIVKRCCHEALKPMHMGEAETDHIEDLDVVLSSSVQCHLRSDVPYGLFLSGGIDSSAMLALMHRHHGPGLKTYSIGFPGTQQHDERGLAAKMAHSVEANHHDVDFTQDDFWNLLPKVVAAHDDPVIDFAALPTFKLAMVASEDVKVVVSGEGGDEVFAGYRRYQRALRPKILGGRIWRGKGVLDAIPNKIIDLDGWDDAIQDTILDLKKRKFTALQKAQYIDFKHWLPNDLLTKLDRCLMAHGVEGRTPFVDKEVAAFGFFLPDHHKAGWSQGKKLLRDWLAKYFPISAPYAKKRGFNVPVGEWMAAASGQIARWVGSQESTQTLLSNEQCQRLFCRMQHDKKSVIPAWVIFYYTLWHRTHIQGKPADAKEILG